MSKLLNRPANILMQILNFDIIRFDDLFLNHILQNRIHEFHLLNVNEYFDLLIKDDHEKEIFTNLLNINYSVFYRNIITFNVIEQFIIPRIVNHKQRIKGKNIRIWSCACASGQEPYTLAMIMENELIAKKDSFNYQIFATDIDAKQIQNAKMGVYTDQVLKNVPLKDIQNWFSVQQEQYAISDALKEKITFSLFDLLDPIQTVPVDSIFGGFDIIMCANLLFYFSEDSRNVILKKLINSSNKNCFFVTGEVERDYFLKQNFYEVYPYSSVFQLSKYLKS
jgi:chemotaxis protein methyltransferase CheR